MTENKEKVIPLVNKKILTVCLIIIVIGAILIFTAPQLRNIASDNEKTSNNDKSTDHVDFITFIEGKQHIVSVLKKDLLFDVSISYDKNKNPEFVNIYENPKFLDIYRQVGFPSQSNDTVFIYPIFTQAAYSRHGFYDYYHNVCGHECLTVSIPSQFVPTYSASMTATIVLSLLNYSHITDDDVDKNPDILKKYHKVIVLHNEYVTKREFDAITSHPNVLYLFPNALYAEVKTDYKNNTIMLIRGHGYPDSSILNGFGWKFDNTYFESNTSCDNMTFTTIPNGSMLNCYPAYRALFDKSFLEMIKTQESNNR